jgi:prephenate dehydrogenase
MFQRVCIVGIGLIGGSFGLALKKHGLAREIVGVARRESTLQAAIERGACDSASTNVVEASTNADLVFLSPPVGQMRTMCKQIAPVVAPGALITDAGSTKWQIVRECEPLFHNRAHFIGGHPMAGSEKTGVEAARADLFEGATWAMTPTLQTDASALQRLKTLVDALGARALSLAPDVHDELLATTSHLPHVAAAALVHVFARANGQHAEAAQLVAGGWRDGTRVAAGSPEMWRDISLANKHALLESLNHLSRELQTFNNALQNDDSDAVFDWFEQAAKERSQF